MGNAGTFAWHSFSTDDRKAVQVGYDLQGGGDGLGSQNLTFSPSVRDPPVGGAVVLGRLPAVRTT